MKLGAAYSTDAELQPICKGGASRICWISFPEVILFPSIPALPLEEVKKHSLLVLTAQSAHADLSCQHYL